ncbi:hypothetical protein HF086_003402 [Spodoptera exigua]|uniref:Ig-like domain-containing protein n=1 Tax=Spodoptera exigua TaxID=7107 RepID=A0A922MFK2_SPOEX|nr:hypothetical protein HF086_003402 [Spodoptera exigua]
MHPSVPPDILDRGTSTDQTVREGASINLTCAATGSPHPQITWRREHSKPITISDGMQVTSFEGPELNISRVTRQHAGAYLCIASNGVPPTVSKRIMLTVQFPPVITIRNQLVGAALGTELVLECETEAYPKPVSYWSRDNGEIVPVGPIFSKIYAAELTYCIFTWLIFKGLSSELKFMFVLSLQLRGGGGLEPHKIDGSYRSVLKLAIRRVTSSDYGTYKCVSKNSLGDTEGTIKLYPMPLPPMENKNVVQRLNIVADKSSESTPFGTQGTFQVTRLQQSLKVSVLPFFVSINIFYSDNIVSGLMFLKFSE